MNSARFRLRPGDIIKQNGQPCRVVRVTDCSAVVEVKRPARDFQTRFGVPVHLQPKPALVRIDPNSDTEILNR